MYRDVPASVYHASPGLSNSMMGHMEPPSRLPVYLSTPREDDEWSILGTLIHQRILEPEKPLPGIAVQPETYGPDHKPWHYGATECKNWRAAQRASNQIVLTPSSYQTLIGCIMSVKRSALAVQVLRDADTELSLWWEINGVLTKRRFDCVPRGNALADLKSCADGTASPREWPWHVKKHGYDRQAAYYLDGYNAWADYHGLPRKTAWCWIAVEKAAPYAVGFHQASEETLSRGKSQYLGLLDTYRECLATGVWPGYGESWNLV
jgi:hypothetical protein